MKQEVTDLNDFVHINEVKITMDLNRLLIAWINKHYTDGTFILPKEIQEKIKQVEGE